MITTNIVTITMVTNITTNSIITINFMVFNPPFSFDC